MECVISPGSFGGVGYEVVLRSLMQWNTERFPVRLFYQEKELQITERTLGLRLSEKPGLTRVPVPPSTSAFGILKLSTEWVAQAPRDRALITGPMKKSDFENGHMGHTGFLKHSFKCSDVAMLFFSDEVRLIPATIHIPLKNVPTAFSQQSLRSLFSVLDRSLDLLGKTKEALRIAVCGLNPHAGEGGTIGSEEVSWLGPTLQDLRDAGWHLSSPLSADSLLTPALRKNYDLIISAYHDQLLPAFKALYFNRSAQVTLGLPILRCSVDHGTAEDLYLKGVADCGSFLYALQLATELLPKGWGRV